jgi:uncharacterized protein YcaQ
MIWHQMEQAAKIPNTPNHSASCTPTAHFKAIKSRANQIGKISRYKLSGWRRRTTHHHALSYSRENHSFFFAN